MLQAVKRARDEAKRQGLPVQGFASPKRWLLVNGHKCQVVTARKKNVPNQKGHLYPAIRLYLPRREWPHFLIYVVLNADPETEQPFYIVPRGMMNKDTYYAPLSGSLHQYGGAWDQLRQPPTEQTAFPYETLPSKTRAAIRSAESFGLRVTLIRKKTPGKAVPHWKDRLLIEGKKCQVMVASRFGSNTRSENWRPLYIRVPKMRGGWKPEFVVYVTWDSDERQDPAVFVVPRWDVMQADTTTTRTGWLTEFENAWQLLRGAKPPPPDYLRKMREELRRSPP